MTWFVVHNTHLFELNEFRIQLCLFNYFPGIKQIGDLKALRSVRELDLSYNSLHGSVWNHLQIFACTTYAMQVVSIRDYPWKNIVYTQMTWLNSELRFLFHNSDWIMFCCSVFVILTLSSALDCACLPVLLRKLSLRNNSLYVCPHSLMWKWPLAYERTHAFLFMSSLLGIFAHVLRVYVLPALCACLLSGGIVCLPNPGIFRADLHSTMSSALSTSKI